MNNLKQDYEELTNSEFLLRECLMIFLKDIGYGPLTISGPFIFFRRRPKDEDYTYAIIKSGDRIQISNGAAPIRERSKYFSTHLPSFFDEIKEWLNHVRED